MSTHQEFPELTPEARAALEVAYKAAFPWHDGHKEEWTESNRKGQAAFLLEAMRQAELAASANAWAELIAIAASLHNPPPPPPTLAEAREAARQLAGPSAEIVHAFLATLGEAGQP